jgi:hypothetical protein
MKGSFGFDDALDVFPIHGEIRYRTCLLPHILQS